MLTEERVYVFVWNTVGQGQTETAMTVKKNMGYNWMFHTLMALA